MYNKGQGVRQNHILAYVWLNLASIIKGVSEAREDRDSVAEKLSFEELIKAQELSQEYYERIQDPGDYDEKIRKAREAKEASEQARRLAAEQMAAERELQRQRSRYFTAIRQKIERNWNKPSGLIGDVDCNVSVIQTLGGEIVDVDVEKCTGGNAALRKSVEKAVWGASPLPAAPDPKLFDRRIRFYFRPD